LPDELEGDVAVPELVEAGGIAGHGGIEVFADLAGEGGSLVDQVAAMADEELQLPPRFLGRGFEECEAVDGRALDGGEIGVAGLVVGVLILTGTVGPVVRQIRGGRQNVGSKRPVARIMK
jgi:hypothetical protein